MTFVGEIIPGLIPMTNQLRAIGFFRERGHGKKDGPSLVESKGQLPAGLRETVAAYLGVGRSIASGGVTHDVLDPEDPRPRLKLSILTDGRWVWPSDLAHYVRVYGVAVPQVFIDDGDARQWRVPILTREEKHLIIEAMRRKEAVYL